MDKLLYGDFEEQYTDYETAEIAILPVPYDGTSTWLKGADKGPRAILEASPNMEFYDIETDSEVYKHGIATLEPVTADSSPQAMAQEVEQRVEAILKDKKFPVLLGGEHSVSSGAFKAIAKYYDTLSILQLDAHSDMRDEYEGSPYNHACVMARGKEITPSVVQVGIRSSAIEEKHNIDPDRIFYAKPDRRYRFRIYLADPFKRNSGKLRKNIDLFFLIWFLGTDRFDELAADRLYDDHLYRRHPEYSGRVDRGGKNGRGVQLAVIEECYDSNGNAIHHDLYILNTDELFQTVRSEPGIDSRRAVQ